MKGVMTVRHLYDSVQPGRRLRAGRENGRSNLGNR